MNSPPAQPRLRRSALVVCAAGLVGLGALLFYGSPAWLPLPDVPTLGETTVPPPDVVQLPPAFTKQAHQYGDIAAPQAPAKTEIVAISPGAPAAAATPPAPGEHGDGWLQTLHPFPSPPTHKPAPAPGRAQAEAKAPAAAAHPPPPKTRWELLAKPDEQASRARSRQVAATEEATGLGPQQERGAAQGSAAQGLIQPARWAIPAEPLRTIYRSQTLHGQLLQAVHSDIPGQVKITLIVPVLDKFGYNTVILPANTLIIAVQEGRVTYGATRLALKLEQLELPSGEVIDLRATVGDDAGSGGMKGKVNNHYGKLILGTGLSALLNIGIKAAVGTPGKNEFFRDPLQDAAEDVGQAVQRTATDIISRELQVRPTITIAAGTLCTLSLQENMQFNRVPLVAR